MSVHVPPDRSSPGEPVGVSRVSAPTESGEADAPPMGVRAVGVLLGAAVASLALTALLSPSVAGIVFLFGDGLPAHPYFVPSHWLLLYVVSPLFAAAAVVMLLAPGVLLVLGSGGGRPRSWTSVVASGFLVAYGLRLLLHSVPKMAGGSLTPGLFWSVEGILMGVGAAGLWIGWRRGRLRMPYGPTRRLWLFLILPALVAVVLAPIVYWQDFTQDGFEALEIGRSLNDYVVPRFANRSGFMGLGIGMLSMAPPVSWFVQLLGPTEAAARLPLALYLPVLAFLLFGLAEHGGRARLGIWGEAMVILVLAAVVSVMGYSATYESYSADLSAPTAFETLTVACLSGIVFGLWERRMPTFLGFVLLGYFARPTTLMLLLLLAASTFVVLRGQDRRATLRYLGFALAVCAAAVVVYERIYLRWASGGTMSYAAESVLQRYAFLRFADLRRFVWVMIPGGILPFLALFAFRRQDMRSRHLSLVLLLYFLAFYLPAFVALHHFVPVMVLPVVVFLRVAGDGPPWLKPVGVATCVVALALALPRHLHVDRSHRELGSRIAFEVGDYRGSPEAHREALASLAALASIFPEIWDVEDPSRERVGAPHSFLHYSAQSGVTVEQADYAILPDSMPPPPGYFEVGSAEGAVAYVRDEVTWKADLANAPSTEFGNPLFVLPRETLFSFIGYPAGEHDIDLGAVPVIWRLF